MRKKRREGNSTFSFLFQKLATGLGNEGFVFEMRLNGSSAVVIRRRATRIENSNPSRDN